MKQRLTNGLFCFILYKMRQTPSVKSSMNGLYRTIFPLLATALMSLGLSTCGDNVVSSRRDTDTTKIGPQLTIPESIFEFGYVPQYSTISHVFWLHSTGDDTLRILKIVPG